MPATVTKLAPNRFLVEGTWAVIAGRVVNEPYSRVHTTKREAVSDAASIDRINTRALVELAEAQVYRVHRIRSYLAARAARAPSAQAEFAF